MSNAEILSLLKSILPIINKAFDYDGDVFGMLHNDATDVLIDVENAIKKLSSEGK